MKVSKAVNYFLDYHRMNSKKNTLRNYQGLLAQFNSEFGEREINPITSEEVLNFLTRITGNKKQSTKRLRYSLH